MLIESGALPGDPQKQRLRALNVAALLEALDAIATRRYLAADPQAYERLPFNTGGASDLLILGGQVVVPGRAPLRADVAVNFDDAVARPPVRDIGDLSDAVAIDTIDAAGLFVHAGEGALAPTGRGASLMVGAPAALVVRRGPDAASAEVQRISAAAERGT